MLALSIDSLRAFYSGSIGVICDESFVDECKQRFPDARVWPVQDAKSGPEASMNKLRIFDFIEDGEYDAVLFLDTDILITNSPMQCFEKMTHPDMLYVYTERTEQFEHRTLYWSLQSYTKEDYEFLRSRNILPFNAGTFGFVASAQMREHFHGVREMIASHTGPYFYEQSFMNVYFNLRDKTDRSVFTKENYIFSPHKGRVYPDAVVLHFADANRPAKLKCDTMRQYMKRWHQYQLEGPEMIELYETREDMLDLVNIYGTYAEIGVFAGEFSDILCRKLNPQKMVLIDLFDGVVGSGDKDGNNFRTIDTSQVYNRLVAASKRFPVLEVLRGDSSTHLARYPDNTFDMIYLDGDHSYEGVKKELVVAYAKTKHDGWIMGHDYEMNYEKAKTRYEFGIKKAVDEFCREYKQRIFAKAMDGCVSFGICVTKE